MTAKVLKFTGRHRTPREMLDAEEIVGVHVFMSGGKWGIRKYEAGRIVEIHGLSRDELATLGDTIQRALDSIPL